MIVADLSLNQISSRLNRGDFVLRTGPFHASIQSPLTSVHRGIATLYADFEIIAQPTFADFHVNVSTPPNLRRWVRPQVIFRYDDEVPFKPLPLDQAIPMLEWGLNWSISNHAHQYLILHAAVIERGGRAVIMPAPPGSGKSTLCAALVNHGWRLLSDELALLSPATGEVIPLARPVSLKNSSINIIRDLGPEVVIGPACKDTLKGTVAHMRPPADSVRRIDENALPAWIIFPRYQPGTGAVLEPYARSQTFMSLVENTFNYHALGEKAFNTLCSLVDHCDCYTFEYDRFDLAFDTFAALAPPAISPLVE